MATFIGIILAFVVAYFLIVGVTMICLKGMDHPFHDALRWPLLLIFICMGNIQ